MILVDYNDRIIDLCISLMLQLLMNLISCMLLSSLSYNKTINL